MNLLQRLCLAALAVLLAFSAKAKTFHSDGRWLRGVAAIYRMLELTGTASFLADAGKSVETASFSGSLSRPVRDPPRVSRKEFIVLARQHEMDGVIRRDRRLLDRNLWDYVSGRANLSNVLHLNKQWGPEGACLSRSGPGNVQHVEDCPVCRQAYEHVIAGTKLHCGSGTVGYQQKEKRDKTDNQGSVIPP